MMFFRYFVVQLLMYGLDVSLFCFALYGMSWGVLCAHMLAKLVVCTLAFVAHRKFTFQVYNTKSLRRQAWRYVVFCTLNIPCSSLVLMLCLNIVSYPIWAKVIADIFCFLLNYWLNKVVVFIPNRVRNA